MKRPAVLALIALIVTVVAWLLGHPGAALAVWLTALSLYMSAYVRHMRPPGPGLLRRSRPVV